MRISPNGPRKQDVLSLFGYKAYRSTISKTRHREGDGEASRISLIEKSVVVY